jgi:pimeloyl-ACP methyl ester carboxylesterase
MSAGAPEVRGVAALAPWVLPGDLPAEPAGRRILIVHGSRDRIADPRRAATVATELGRRTEVTYVLVEGGHHAMLRRHDLFDGLAADFAALVLLGEAGNDPISRVAKGERFITL